MLMEVGQHLLISLGRGPLSRFSMLILLLGPLLLLLLATHMALLGTLHQGVA